MALYFILLDIIVPWLYFTVLYSTLLYRQLYFAQVDSTTFYHSTILDPTFTCQGSTLLHITLPWLYSTLLDSTLLFNSTTSLPLGFTSSYQFVLTLPTLISATFHFAYKCVSFRLYMWYDLEGLSRDKIDNTG